MIERENTEIFSRTKNSEQSEKVLVENTVNLALLYLCIIYNAGVPSHRDSVCLCVCVCVCVGVWVCGCVGVTHPSLGVGGQGEGRREGVGEGLR